MNQQKLPILQCCVLNKELLTSELFNLGSICQNLSRADISEIEWVEEKDNELVGIIAETDFLEGEVGHDGLSTETRSGLSGHKS